MNVGIIGNNLASLTLAKTLVNDGICVDLIYNQDVRNINKTRTIGIARSNIDFFNKNILNISKLLWQINKIEISLEKSKKTKTLNFINNNKQLFSIIKNYKLYELINNSLKKNKFFKKKKIPYNKLLEKNNYELLINCESNNPITKKFFYRKTKKNYKSISYVSIIKHKKIKHNDIAYQIFTKFGPIAFLPISKCETSIVYSVKKNENLSSTDVIKLIKEYNPKYTIINIKKIESFDLFFSLLRTYYHKNILAFGDLLHRIHPLAGQGFNMTIRDIKQLKKIINHRQSLGLCIDSTICLDFEKELKHKNFLFSSGIDFIHEFFDLEKKFQSDKISKAVEQIGKNKFLNNLFTKLADDGIYT